MIRLKSSALLLAGLLTATAIPMVSASANDAAEQDKPRFAEKMAEQRAERLDTLFDSWNLDEESRDAFTQAQQDYREQRQALREEHKARIGEILDDEQIEALHATMRPTAGKHGMGRHGSDQHGSNQHKGQPGKMVQALFDSWDLSDDQRNQLAQAHEQFMTQARELRDQSFDNRDERREAFQALRDEHRQALDEVLSDEQMTVLEQMMQSRHHRHGRGHKG